jgi:hypothetical protein
MSIEKLADNVPAHWLQPKQGANFSVPQRQPDVGCVRTLAARRNAAHGACRCTGHPAVPADVVWGIPQAKVMAVLRLPAEVVTDRSAFFSSDRLGVRCVTRWGFAFPHQAAIVKISMGGSWTVTAVPGVRNPSQIQCQRPTLAVVASSSLRPAERC